MKKEHSIKIRFGILEWIPLLIMAAIGGAMIWCTMELKSCPYQPSEIHKHYDTIFVENSKRIISELEGIKSTQRIDSIVATVAANQLVIMKRQDDLINDQRQETNNNLDKTNLLISFWVGIMALLGVFIPIILQFKIHHIAKSEVEKIKAELETIKSDSKTAVNQEIKKVSSQMDEWKKEVKILHYINELSSIYLGAQYRLIPEINNRREVFGQIWQQSNKKFAYIIDNTFKDTDTDQNRAQLMECLINVSATLRLIISETSRNRHRSVMEANNKVKEVMKMVNSRDYLNWQALHTTFEELLSKLRSIDFED